MIDWIIALFVGLGVFLAVYAGAFSVSMIVSKGTGFGRNVKDRPWLSNLIVGPVVLTESLLVIVFLAQGQLTSWGLQYPSFEGILAVGFSGSVLAVLTLLTSESISPTPSEMKPPSDSRGRFGFFVLIVILASISEELIFRGVIQNLLDQALLLALDLGFFSLTGGTVVSGLLFAVVHAAPAKRMGVSLGVLVGSALVLGLSAGIALYETGSLLAPILIHGLFNFFGFAIGIREDNEENAS
ncbi:CPBP family intramembrane metalloprotease [Candidatus Thorarchaeota archaeon]|jgi:membrane protease YdiL (CAAX protease family)|nr:MAG: CPBP family intramembrane metalloprotease [Candidatus Thorarchaeota archaeon]